MCPWSSLCTVTFKKLASLWLLSVVNVMVLLKEFKASKIGAQFLKCIGPEHGYVV